MSLKRLTHVERRMIRWAECHAYPPHEPGRPAESIEYRIMTGQAMKARGKNFGDSDGGMARDYERFGGHIAEVERRLEIDAIMRQLKHIDEPAHEAVFMSYLARPGEIIPARLAAEKIGVALGTFNTRYRVGMAFVSGAMVGKDVEMA